MTDPSSRQRGWYIRTTTASVQLENKNSGRESQGACRQEELIGGKPPVVKEVWLWSGLVGVTQLVESLDSWDRSESIRSAGGWCGVATSLEVSCETVADQWGREQGRWRIYGVGSRYQTKAGEGRADWEYLVRAVVNCWVCELTIAL
jgi:hypothetical protein